MSDQKKQESTDWTVPVITGTAAVIIAYLMKGDKAVTAPIQESTENDQPVLYAFVSNPKGARIYKSQSNAIHPIYGNGREPITILSNGTYIGKLTGITYEQLIQVITEIDGAQYAYWVHKNDVNTLDKAAGSMDQLREKLQSDLKAIANTFSETLVNKIFG